MVLYSEPLSWCRNDPLNTSNAYEKCPLKQFSFVFLSFRSAFLSRVFSKRKLRQPSKEEPFPLRCCSTSTSRNSSGLLSLLFFLLPLTAVTRLEIDHPCLTNLGVAGVKCIKVIRLYDSRKLDLGSAFLATGLRMAVGRADNERQRLRW